MNPTRQLLALTPVTPEPKPFLASLLGSLAQDTEEQFIFEEETEHLTSFDDDGMVSSGDEEVDFSDEAISLESEESISLAPSEEERISLEAPEEEESISLASADELQGIAFSMDETAGPAPEPEEMSLELGDLTVEEEPAALESVEAQPGDEEDFDLELEGFETEEPAIEVQARDDQAAPIEFEPAEDDLELSLDEVSEESIGFEQAGETMIIEPEAMEAARAAMQARTAQAQPAAEPEPVDLAPTEDDDLGMEGLDLDFSEDAEAEGEEDLIAMDDSFSELSLDEDEVVGGEEMVEVALGGAETGAGGELGFEETVALQPDDDLVIGEVEPVAVKELSVAESELDEDLILDLEPETDEPLMATESENLDMGLETGLEFDDDMELTLEEEPGLDGLAEAEAPEVEVETLSIDPGVDLDSTIVSAEESLALEVEPLDMADSDEGEELDFSSLDLELEETEALSDAAGDQEGREGDPDLDGLDLDLADLSLDEEA
ncbi:MAG: hypothetical protein KKB20_28855 [Proteobacteria bacterium]|nr:hypothetical protein [Pseudomonadota bacterium]